MYQRVRLWVRRYSAIIQRLKKSTPNDIAPFLIVVLFCVCSAVMPSVKAKASMTDLRVGLTELYSGCSSIKIKNTGLSLGYCINESFETETTLFGADGFIFTPATGYFYVCSTVFDTYKGAREVADLLISEGVKAYPCAVYRGYWLLYIGGGDSIAARTERAIAITKTEYSFELLTGDNSNRIMVTANPDTFIIDAGIKGAYPQFKAVKANGLGVYAVDLGMRSYRGRIEIGRYGRDGLTAVNILNVEAYLYSVVSCEMNTSWPIEALKAQAVCARSYAVVKTGYSADSNIDKPYILDDSTNSQAYLGLGYETQAAKNAVISTMGQTVTRDGKTIMTFYFSTSGGATENIYDVWGIESDVFVSVPDTYETSPEVQPWVVSQTMNSLSSRLKNAGLKVGSITELIALKTTSAGSISSLRINGSDGSAILQTDSIRSVLGVHSTKFKIIKYGDIPDLVSILGRSSTISERISNCYILDGSGTVQKAAGLQQQYIVKSAENLMNFPASAPEDPETVLLAGMGSGHGVGMSQSGAKGMAEAGYDYKAIIEYYYNGCVVK